MKFVNVTSTLVPNDHVALMLADGWDSKGQWNQTHTVMRKAGKHMIINGVSENVYRQLQRNMVIEYRFQIIK